MRAVVVSAVIVATMAAFITEPFASNPRSAAAPTGSVRDVTIRVGDVVRVEGGRLACIVRRSALERLLDCRRVGRLVGTYGTFVGEKRVRVVRFRSNREARVILTAWHGGEAKCCG
jgi:NMD protein affecting ribosome stability and mRNA decay